MTLDVTYTQKHFANTNPKTTEAFIEALDETNKFVAENKELAAQFCVNSSKVKIYDSEVGAILNDLASKLFNDTSRHHEFLGHTGTFKTKPSEWNDLLVRDFYKCDGE